MLIRMLKTTPGSRNGLVVEDFVGGREYDLTATAGERRLAASFLRDGAAEEVPNVPVQPHPEPLPPAGGVDDAADPFDPATADLDAVRAFLDAKGVKPHYKVGEAKLRELAVEALAKG